MPDLCHPSLPLLAWALETSIVLGLTALGLATGVAVVVTRRRHPPPAPSSARSVAPVAELAPPIEAERRQSPRHSSTPVLVHLRAGTGDPIDGLILDVSEGGVGLSVKGPLPLESHWELRAATAAPTVPWVRVEIRHCSPFAARFRVGCRFLDPLDPQVRLLFG